MGTLSLEQACKAIAALPWADRPAAARALARTVTRELDAGPGWSTLDPLQCTPDRAAHCLAAGEAVAVGNEVCLSVLERDLACPFGAWRR
ncbi:MAG TPA: hypothetical protein VFR85_01360 [Anaeromyxobacteraceae bacterium]|nr:hypothetical protein [Anaeromyxobacteraceae bacterium]